jgi:hypothetical protein
MSKVYERTENGTTAYVSVREGVDEAERAMADRRGVRSMSSARGRHTIEYRDGRKVRLVLVNAPEEPKKEEAPGRAFTVIYTGSGEPIVHAAGCAHNVRDSLRGVHSAEDITGTLEDVAARVYADMIEEDPDTSAADYVAHLSVKPCAR